MEWSLVIAVVRCKHVYLRYRSCDVSDLARQVAKEARPGDGSGI